MLKIEYQYKLLNNDNEICAYTVVHMLKILKCVPYVKRTFSF